MCLEAGVPCVALDSATNSFAPRSIARYLEARIAALERQPSSDTAPSSSSNSVATGQPTAISNSTTLYPTTSAIPVIGNALHDITPSFLGLIENLALPGCAAAPTQIPSAKRSLGLTDLDENHPRSILNQPPSHILVRLGNGSSSLCRLSSASPDEKQIRQCLFPVGVRRPRHLKEPCRHHRSTP
ncbi:hypothetical protein ABEF95_011577 [Exophiala dermatitidis]